MKTPTQYTSNAEWPVEAGVVGNTTSDTHPTREFADGVCSMLQREGFGGDKQIFPIRTWVEPNE